MILLDTNTLIDHLKVNPAVIPRSRSVSPKEVAIPSVVAYELEYGTLKIESSRRQAVVWPPGDGIDRMHLNVYIPGLQREHSERNSRRPEGCWRSYERQPTLSAGA
jgi:hypothetical protein